MFTAFAGGDQIDEEAALEMIELMLDGAAEQAAGLKFEERAVLDAGLDLDALGAGDFEREAGKAEATLEGLDLGFCAGDFRVDENGGACRPRDRPVCRRSTCGFRDP